MGIICFQYTKVENTKISFMKRTHFIILGIIIIIVILFFVDRKVWMRQRVTRHHLWEHVGYPNGGERIRGDFIDIPENVSFHKNMMIFEYSKESDTRQNDTLILRYQYFSVMKITDPKTDKTGKYCMKGASWVDFCIFGRLNRRK